jgi:outer membrane protein OmpA-like peptidoglycan-associated protein
MKTRIVVTTFLFGLAVICRGQNVILKTPAEMAVAKAKDLIASEKYQEAVQLLKETLEKSPDDAEALFFMGTAYQGLNQGEKAQEYFSRSNNIYQSLLKGKSFGANEAIKLHMLQYRQRYAEEQPVLAKANATMKDPIRLREPINTEFEDYFPMLDPMGTRLYFTSKRPNTKNVRSVLKSKSPAKKETEITRPQNSDDDIYFVDKTGDVWSDPVKLPEPLNTDENDGTASFSANGELMVLAACGLPDAIGSCDLYFSTKENEQWMAPKNMGNVVNSSDWDSQPTLSYDGSKIFFSSGRCNGYGETDIYMIEKNNFGEWGIPVNLGPIVNTPFNEYSPFFSQDGKTLYFSSNGHPGFCGMDIFKTVYENGKWSVPVNLGKPLNTAGDDRFFTIGGSGEIGYFASDRDGKGLDLYQIEIPEEMRPQPTIIITGTVTNAKTNSVVSAYVMVEDINTNELIAVNKSNSSGKYLAVLPAGRTYSVSANKEGFFFYSQSFDVPKQTKYQEIIKDIQLKPIEKGTKVVINNIFFETGKAILTPQSHLELEKAFDLLRTNPSMVIEVGGHTDNIGDEESNMKLSHDRAKAVREYLVNRGINTDRIQAKGYGELNPIATNDTDDGRKANRRTEFVILDF